MGGRSCPFPGAALEPVSRQPGFSPPRASVHDLAPSPAPPPPAPVPATAWHQPRLSPLPLPSPPAMPSRGPVGALSRPPRWLTPPLSRPETPSRHALPCAPHREFTESGPQISGSQNARPRGCPGEPRLALADAGARCAASGYADTRRTPCCLSPLGVRGPRGCGAALNSESTRFLLVWGTTFSLSLYKCVIFFHYKSRTCLL